MDLVTELPVLPPRPADSHKGTFGKVLVVAGSRGMTGAAILTGRAALRGGAGLVQVATPFEVQPVVAAGHPCYTTAGLPGDAAGRLDPDAEGELLALAATADVVALGPGLGQGPALAALVARLVERLGVPLVLDADGLNALAGQTNILQKRSAATVLTPHPGEFARLLGGSTGEVQAHREERAAEFADRHGVVLLLKGHGTLVTDGRRLYRNDTGNPGMATGGTGDVLTGVIAALLGQGLDGFAAAQLGAWVHGTAGDRVRDAVGEIALVATDLLDYLPAAFVTYARDRAVASE
jgi:ADP-dependent NAD(P)H-hydrate dehydratase